MDSGDRQLIPSEGPLFIAHCGWSPYLGLGGAMGPLLQAGLTYNALCKRQHRQLPTRLGMTAAHVPVNL